MHPSIERILKQMSDERDRLFVRVGEIDKEIAQVKNEMHEQILAAGLSVDGCRRLHHRHLGRRSMLSPLGGGFLES